MWNPYDFANPVDDSRLFAGREPELKDIRYYLKRAARAPRPINLVLTGARSSGKTSLLNKVAIEAADMGFCVARIDLNEADADPYALFYKIYDAIIFAAASDGAFAGLAGRTYAQYRQTMDGIPSDGSASEFLFPQHYASASRNGRPLSEPTLKADLQKISSELAKPCILLFDECDVLSKSRIELEMLRNVFMNTHGYMLVFAGTPHLFPVMEEVFSPIVRQFKKIPVERFVDLDDTMQCVKRPLESLGIDPNKALIPSPLQVGFEIDRLSEGRPYEIQLLCHYMFKRVEDGDARDMAITVDVLDDVRQELEKQEIGTGRRTLSALPQLERDDFVLLQALTEFRGTVEQLSLRSRLFGQQGFEVETLRGGVNRFSALGLLTESDDDGIVRFAGDQFDEVYARYFAAADDMRLFIWDGDFWADFRSTLVRLLDDAIDDVEVIHLPIAAAMDTKRRLQDALSVLLGQSPLPSSGLPDAASSLYTQLLYAHERGSLVLAAVRFAGPALESPLTQWVILPSGDEDAFLGHEILVALTKRAKAAQIVLDVEIFRYDLEDRSTFVDRVRSSASPNQLADFGDKHFTIAFTYYDEGDLEQALHEFENALEFSPEPSHATSVAHVSLTLGNYDRAAESAGIARQLALDWSPETDLEQYAFATYDLAVALVMLGKHSDALVLLDECEDLVEMLPQFHGYLAYPEIEGDDVVLRVTDDGDQPLTQVVGRVRGLLAKIS